MSKTANGQTLIQAFESWAPQSLAMEEDRGKIGLQVGTLNKPVKTIMVALDVLGDVIDEAVSHRVDLIIAHHPLIFHPLKKIATDSAHGRIIEKCMKHDITVYAAHTNLDAAKGGVNDLMAEALQLQNTEVLVPVDKQAKAEEGIGLGRVGTLEETMTLGTFADYVKQAFDVKGLRIVGDLKAPIKKVALLGGDGNKYMTEARMKGADVFVTGDVYYHTAHDAWMEGLNIVDPGHNIEKVMKGGVSRFLEQFVREKHYDIKILTSKIHTDPFVFL